MSPTYRHLRLVAVADAQAYFHATWLWSTLGPEGFAELVARGEDEPPPRTPGHFVFHSWLPQFVALGPEQAEAVRVLRALGPDAAPPPGEARRMADLLEAMGWCLDEPVDLDHLLRRVATEIVAIQNPAELRWLCERVAAARPRVVVEIGTARGGTLYALTQLAAPDALVVAIDRPGAAGGGGQLPSEHAFFQAFTGPSQTLHLLGMDSHDEATFAALERLLDGRGIDLLFIDGDHRYAGAKADVERYQRLLAPHGIMALHDIAVFPEVWGEAGGVGPLWRELAASAATASFIDPDGHHGTAEPPPGVARAWGIGLVFTPRSGSWGRVLDGGEG